MNELGKVRPELEQRAEIREKDMEGLHELGERFVRDKNALEERLKKVQKLALPEEQKAALVTEIEGVLQQLQEQYDRDVADKQDELAQEAEADQKEVQEREREREELAASLREAKMEAAQVDLRSLSEMTERERQRFAEEHAAIAQRMNAMQADARLQRESIRQQPNG